MFRVENVSAVNIKDVLPGGGGLKRNSQSLSTLGGAAAKNNSQTSLLKAQIDREQDAKSHLPPIPNSKAGAGSNV